MFHDVLKGRPWAHCSRQVQQVDQRVLRSLGPNITYGDDSGAKRTYTVAKPVGKFQLVDEQTYEVAHQSYARKGCMMEHAYLLAHPAYDLASPADHEKKWGGHAKGGLLKLDRSLAFWGVDPAGSDYDVTVFVCPPRIEALAPKLADKVPEVDERRVLELVFKTVLLHEVGHHFTLSNLSYKALKEVIDISAGGINDALISEGLASWFAYNMSPPEGRLILAQMAVSQSIGYRIYLFLKHADVSALLDALMALTSYQDAIAAMAKVLGSIYNMNGRMLSSAGKFDGVAIDWSGKGGTVLSQVGIKALTTMSSGCFIAPRIEHLIGRFPDDVLIVANELDNVHDYNVLPPNVIVIPADKADIGEAVSRNLSRPTETRIGTILAELGIGGGGLRCSGTGRPK